MAIAIGKPPSTVNSWNTRGSIPDPIKPLVMKCAKERDIALKPEHFFPDLNENGDVE